MMAGSLPAPDEVRATFAELYRADPEKAVAYLHGLGVKSGYLKAEAIERTIRWESESAYGTLECTINLSKPEKDPRAIAAAAAMAHGKAGGVATATGDAEKAATASGDEEKAAPANDSDSPLSHPVPQCDLCWENEGFPGAPDHPAKPGLRIAAIELGGETWGLQYSPYAYFPEHCIALSREHRLMKIDAACFGRLLDFVDAFPFYFVGSNADLPIVGGSILSHDHFQGGRHEFPLMRAPVEREVALPGTGGVRCGVVRWPASALRLASENRAALAEAASRVLDAWLGFSNRACGIEAASANAAGTIVAHNTLNPIVRKTGSTYTMDLVLRNNRADAEHPWGIFHPGEELHHIKKENIGLVEIMGLAILPPRLATELSAVQRELEASASAGLSAETLESRLNGHGPTAPHAAWAKAVYAQRQAEFLDNGTASANARKPAAGRSARALHSVIEDEVGRVFARILEATGVFKRDETGRAGWDAFLDELR